MNKETIFVRYTDPTMPRLQGIRIGNAVDLYTAEDVVLHRGEHRLISLGVAMKLPSGYHAEIYPRSSTFGNYGILLANSIGLVDESYCGNDDIWKASVVATRDVEIPKHTRIVQFQLRENQPSLEFVEVNKLDNTNRGGFGSTGK